MRIHRVRNWRRPEHTSHSVEPFQMRWSTACLRSMHVHHALCALLIVCAIAVAPTLFAEPYEDNPGAAAGDPDYAAGKAAMEKKNWKEALRRFNQALLRDPDSADLHN